jgi:hypothetical protein
MLSSSDRIRDRRALLHVAQATLPDSAESFAGNFYMLAQVVNPATPPIRDPQSAIRNRQSDGLQSIFSAKVAELADAPDLGSGSRKAMGVRLPPFAFDSPLARFGEPQARSCQGSLRVECPERVEGRPPARTDR